MFVDVAKHTDSAVAYYMRFAPEISHGKCGFFYSKKNGKGDFPIYDMHGHMGPHYAIYFKRCEAPESITFSYHNHWAEYELADGIPAMYRILDDTLVE